MSIKESVNFLIVSNELNVMEFDIDDVMGRCHFLTPKTIKEATAIIANQNIPLHAIILDPLLEANGLAILGNCYQERLCVPLYLKLRDEEEVPTNEFMDKYGLQGVLKNHDSLKEIIEIIDKKITSVENYSLNNGKQEHSALVGNNEFNAINAINFLSGTKNFFDIFIKLKENKYLRLLKAGDQFEDDRLRRYMAKGLRLLYVKNDDQKKYLEYCQDVTNQLLSSEKISNEIKVAQTFNHGHETIKYLQKNGLDQESVQFAESFAINVFKSVSALTSKSEAVKLFLGNITSFEHCVGTAMIAGLIAKKYGINENDLIEIVGNAAILHDIGLYKQDYLYDSEIEYKYFSEEDIEIELENQNLAASRRRDLEKMLLEHPKIGADMVRQIKGFNPLIAQIIEQHHMLPDESTEINEIAQIIAISDMLTKTLKLIATKKWPKKKLLMFPYQILAYSGDIVKLFLTTFQFK